MSSLPGGHLQKGQALLLVLLAMSVTLMVVLSTVSKTVTDVTITTMEEESLRAFSAAEAGIEQALLNTVVTTSTGNTGSASYTYTVKNTGNNSNSYIYPDDLSSGEVATFWFIGHDNNGNLTCDSNYGGCTSTNKLEFCWGNSLSETPAIEIIIYYDDTNYPSGANIYTDFSKIEVKRYYYDSTNRTPSNNFDLGNPSCFISGMTYSTSNISSIPNNLIMAKVRMLYNTTPQPVALNVQSGKKLANQGFEISSIGTSSATLRKLTVFRGYSEPPSVFEGVLYSGNSLIK